MLSAALASKKRNRSIGGLPHHPSSHPNVTVLTCEQIRHIEVTSLSWLLVWVVSLDGSVYVPHDSIQLMHRLALPLLHQWPNLSPEKWTTEACLTPEKIYSYSHYKTGYSLTTTWIWLFYSFHKSTLIPLSQACLARCLSNTSSIIFSPFSSMWMWSINTVLQAAS